MPGTHTGRLGICVILLALWSPVADAAHPLEPLDLSSPRATLNSFLTMGDATYQLLSDAYWHGIPRAVQLLTVCVI